MFKKLIFELVMRSNIFLICKKEHNKQKSKMFQKTLLAATVALAALASCADAKYTNAVSWAHWGDGNDGGCGRKFASECAGMVDKPVAAWLQQIGDYITIIEFTSFYSQKYDVYSDCWCRKTITYSSDNATYVQGEHGKPPGSSDATVASDGTLLLPGLTVVATLGAAVANIL